VKATERLDAGAEHALELALREALSRGRNTITTLDLIRGAARAIDDTEVTTSAGAAESWARAHWDDIVRLATDAIARSNHSP
jgi:hypothetical protein